MLANRWQGETANNNHQRWELPGSFILRQAQERSKDHGNSQVSAYRAGEIQKKG